MQVIDLTHTIYADMPAYPGTNPPRLEQESTIEEDGFREMRITMASHTGTHIDAPAHMLEDGPCLDDFDAGQFMGKACVLDFSKYTQREIGVDALAGFARQIKSCAFVLLYTGWDRYWKEEKYFSNFPVLSKEAAVWLSGFSLKGIGIDTVSMDAMDSDDFAVHKTLMRKNMILIENLTNLKALGSDCFLLSILPLKTKKADGSPVRAVGVKGVV